ncbi:hypothetical protein P9112_006501 [Eukaryota sp. TZLM1-RC]
MSDIIQQDISDPNSSPNIQQQEPARYTHTHNEEGNEVTDPDPTSPYKKEEVEREDEVPPSDEKEVTRTDPAPSPLPNIEPVSKGTDENPALDTFSPLGEYEEIQSQLDEMEEEDDSSDAVYKLLTRTQSLTSIPWTFIHTSSSLPLWTQHKKSRLHTRLQIETPPPLLLTTMANIRSLLL